MSETSGRLLRLLSLLQARPDWPGSELAGRLGVTVRTVRRDVDRLRMLGYPVLATSGVAGYRLGAGATLPPLLLDDDEAVAVAIGLRMAAGGGVTGIEETSVRALAKLEQVLPSRVRNRVSTLQAATVPMTSRGPTVDPGTLTAIAGACRDNRQLRFDYRSHEGTPSVRTVDPHRLVNAGRRWYLVAWDNDPRDWRTFRADRITLREWSGPRFKVHQPPDPDLAGYTSWAVSTAAYRYHGRFTVHAPAEFVGDRMGPTVAVVEPIDDQTCALRAGSNSLDELAVWIAIMGVEFDIHEPPELLGYIRTLVGRLQRAASPVTPR
jgi:predicted DNA-binding transcriptional regulator YafY